MKNTHGPPMKLLTEHQNRIMGIALVLAGGATIVG